MEATMASVEAPTERARHLGGAGARRQIGGVVGAVVGDAATTRLRDALGEAADLLEPPHPMLVAEWGAWTGGGEPLQDWQEVLSAGRLADVEGAFAVAWIDDVGTLHLARDGVGERSLFYAHDGERLTFASTIRALVVSRATSARVNRNALPAYLSYGYVPGRDTLVGGVHELHPGEHLTFSGGRLSAERFWSLPAEDDDPRTDDEYCAELRGLVETAVLRRLP